MLMRVCLCVPEVEVDEDSLCWPQYRKVVETIATVTKLKITKLKITRVWNYIAQMTKFEIANFEVLFLYKVSITLILDLQILSCVTELPKTSVRTLSFRTLSPSVTNLVVSSFLPGLETTDVRNLHYHV